MLADLSKRFHAGAAKDAIDSLNTGIMFCEENGSVILQNAVMQSLMEQITGEAGQNGRQFYGALALEEVSAGCKITWFCGRCVCLLPDCSAWMFTLKVLRIKGKKYRQLTATDVTAQWRLTSELAPQNEELKRRQRALELAIANLHILSRERETQRAKMRAHDVLGERLTLMLRVVRGEREPDYAMLRGMSRELMDELKAASFEVAPQDRLAMLKQVFQSIGVEIHLEGELPQSAAKGRLVADISGEAVANAVRHGLATRVDIRVDNTDDGGLRLRISDNGRPAAGPLVEGGGLSGMREKVKPFGGTVAVSVSQGFVLNIELPGGDEDA